MTGLLFSAACLPAGFAVALATGVRPLGGIVLLALALAAARLSGATAARQALWLVIVAACFAASHVLADSTGRWGAIAIVAAIATAAYAGTRRPIHLGGNYRPLDGSRGSRGV